MTSASHRSHQRVALRHLQLTTHPGLPRLPTPTFSPRSRNKPAYLQCPVPLHHVQVRVVIADLTP
jgi:hypothetical protein